MICAKPLSLILYENSHSRTAVSRTKEAERAGISRRSEEDGASVSSKRYRRASQAPTFPTHSQNTRKDVFKALFHNPDLKSLWCN